MVEREDQIEDEENGWGTEEEDFDEDELVGNEGVNIV